MVLVRVLIEYEVKATTIEDAQDELAEKFANENILAENEYWENMFIVGEKKGAKR